MPLDGSFEVENSKQVDRSFCTLSKNIIESQRRPFKFAGYSKIIALEVSHLTEHQYFLCTSYVFAYVVKIRQWGQNCFPSSLNCNADDILVNLQVSGIQKPQWDFKMLDTLVLEPHTKRLIQGLTEKYIKGLKADDEKQASLINPERLNPEVKSSEESSWSADFIKGKGEGLIFLLHGKPGVGKTYTAG